MSNNHSEGRTAPAASNNTNGFHATSSDLMPQSQTSAFALHHPCTSNSFPYVSAFPSASASAALSATNPSPVAASGTVSTFSVAPLGLTPPRISFVPALLTSAPNPSPAAANGVVRTFPGAHLSSTPPTVASFPAPLTSSPAGGNTSPASTAANGTPSVSAAAPSQFNVLPVPSSTTPPNSTQGWAWPSPSLAYSAAAESTHDPFAPTNASPPSPIAPSPSLSNIYTLPPSTRGVVWGMSTDPDGEPASLCGGLYLSISLMQMFSSHSVEELRYGDYGRGDKVLSGAPMPPMPSMPARNSVFPPATTQSTSNLRQGFNDNNNTRFTPTSGNTNGFDFGHQGLNFNRAEPGAGSLDSATGASFGTAIPASPATFGGVAQPNILSTADPAGNTNAWLPRFGGNALGIGSANGAPPRAMPIGASGVGALLERALVPHHTHGMVFGRTTVTGVVAGNDGARAGAHIGSSSPGMSASERANAEGSSRRRAPLFGGCDDRSQPQAEAQADAQAQEQAQARTEADEQDGETQSLVQQLQATGTLVTVGVIVAIVIALAALAVAVSAMVVMLFILQILVMVAIVRMMG